MVLLLLLVLLLLFWMMMFAASAVVAVNRASVDSMSSPRPREVLAIMVFIYRSSRWGV